MLQFLNIFGIICLINTLGVVYGLHWQQMSGMRKVLSRW